MGKTKAIIVVMAIVLVIVIYLFLDKIEEILTSFGVV
jgi:hypothetical protein